MNKELYVVIREISTVSSLIPLTCLSIYFKRQPKQNLILAISLVISLVFDLIGFMLIRGSDPMLTNVSNNLYVIVAFPAIMLFYHETLIKKKLKTMVRVFTIGFLVVALICTVEQGLNQMNFSTMTLSSILITITSFFFVADLNLMDQSSFTKNAFHQTNIILNTSLAVYYFATILIFAASDYIYLHVSMEDSRYLWASHNSTNILKNIGIAVAFYLSAKQRVGLTNFQKS